MEQEINQIKELAEKIHALEEEVAAMSKTIFKLRRSLRLYKDALDAINVITGGVNEQD
jgi:prefoldin subunit 5